MNSRRPLLLSALATTLLGSALVAQSPLRPPPWWGVSDNVTVSLYWNFSGLTPLVPQVVAAPAWYNPNQTQGTATGPLAVIPTLAGHTDVYGLVGNGTSQSALLRMKVDNDPHLDWVKIFWFQFDSFEGASGSITESIRKDLAKYERSSVNVTSVPIGGGWETVTMTAQLWPQPDDEEIDWTFTENAFGNAAIDNLFVNSKCVKLDDADEDGDALGETDGAPIDLDAATGGALCLASAVTQGPAPTFARSIWVSALAASAGTAHRLFQLTPGGVQVSVTTLPDTLASAPGGAVDLAVETIQLTPTTHQQFLYALIDQRAAPAGNILLRAIDTNGTLVSGRNVIVAAFPALAQPTAVAFSPSGNTGLGAFWITDQNSNLYEVARTGQILRATPNSATGVPPQVTGIGYDHIFGNLYFFSQAANPTPIGPLRVNGVEVSAYDLQRTGTRFWGNLQIPNAGATPGGIAGGIEVYRRLGTGDFRATCVVSTPTKTWLYELKGPFRFGHSIYGTCGMTGEPFRGSNNFQLTLSTGSATATFASLYAGFSNTAFGATPLPLTLTGFGMDENYLHISPDMHSALMAPTAGIGRFVFPMPVLPLAFANTPLFFQWLVFDPTVPGGIAVSQPAKTLIY